MHDQSGTLEVRGRWAHPAERPGGNPQDTGADPQGLVHSLLNGSVHSATVQTMRGSAPHHRVSNGLTASRLVAVLVEQPAQKAVCLRTWAERLLHPVARGRRLLQVPARAFEFS